MRNIIPQGMTEVTHERFFQILNSMQHDIMPSTRDPICTWWNFNGSDQIWGWCSQGWKNTDNTGQSKPAWAIQSRYVA